MRTLNLFFALVPAAIVACGGPAQTTGGASAESGSESDSGPEEPWVPRDAFGRAEIPIWHPTGPFEQAAYAGIPKAQQGDALASFDLALVGSAHLLSMEQAQALRDKLTAFIDKVRPEVEAQTDPWQRGFTLHRAMHRDLMGGLDKKEELSNYDFDQSALAPILRTGKFNCVSSALLFGVLARAFGFEVQGVLIPSHVFVQLTLSDGRKLEVETTSTTGFDWIHDAKFYAEGAKSWSARRGLRPATVADYQARKLVSLAELIAHNMGNQHTRADGVTAWDRSRLHEFSGALSPDSTDSVQNRLSIYLNEYIILEKHAAPAESVRLFDRIWPAVEDAATRHAGHPAIASSVRWLFAERPESLIAVGRAEEAFSLVERAIALTGGPDEDSRKARAYALAAVENAAAAHVEGGRFAEAEATMARFAEACAQDETCRLNRFSHLLNWGNAELKATRYASAIEKYSASRAVAPDAEKRDVALKNTQIAFVNEAVTLGNEGNWPKAAEVLSACVAFDPAMADCAQRLADLVSQHRM